MTRKIINFALFQVVWFACVLSGKHQLPLVALAASVAIVAVSLWMQSGRRLANLRLLGLVAVIGFCVDSLNLRLGVFALNDSPVLPYLCPVWLVALWAAFGTTLRGSLSWLAGRYWLSAALGAVAGAASYLAGAKLGAVALNPDRAFSTTVLVITWALILPLLVWLAHGRNAPELLRQIP